MSRPLVSVTSAFYNTGPVLLDMVRSIFRQSFEDWELVLLDDGSTDSSLAIAQSIADPRVRVFSNGKNRGIPASLNRLTELSQGKYIARMDSDDMSGRERIARQARFLEENPEVDVVGCGCVSLDEKDQPLGYAAPKAAHAEICQRPYTHYRMAHPTIFAEREWFQRNPYQENIKKGEDYNLFLRTFDSSIYANIPEPLFYYRLGNSFKLRKQIVFRSSVARFVFAYHAEQGRYGRAAALLVRQYAKFLAESFYCLCGCKKQLLARRYQVVSDKELQTYIDEIKEIKGLILPIEDGGGNG